MRLDSKLPPKKPLRRPDPPAKKPALTAKPRGVSWWTACAGPEQREAFAAAARQRDEDGKYDPVWQRPENFQQLGAKANS